MAFKEVWAKSVNNDFVVQVQVAMVREALAVVSEDPAVPNHASRVAFANRVLQNSHGCAQTMALGVATNEKAFESEDDGVILEVVMQQWNAFAGISPDQEAAVIAEASPVVAEPVVKPTLFSFLKRG